MFNAFSLLAYHLYCSIFYLFPRHYFSQLILAQDVSGFTPMTEQLGKRGAESAELVRDILSSYLSRLLEVVDDYHGDVIKVCTQARARTYTWTQARSKQGCTHAHISSHTIGVQFTFILHVKL